VYRNASILGALLTVVVGEAPHVSGGGSGGLLGVNPRRPTSLSHAGSLGVVHPVQVVCRRLGGSGGGCVGVISGDVEDSDVSFAGVRMGKVISRRGDSVGGSESLLLRLLLRSSSSSSQELVLIVTVNVGDGTIDELENLPNIRARHARSEADRPSRR
jgi:hypothetical protein